MIHIIKNVLSPEAAKALCAQTPEANFAAQAREDLSRTLLDDPMFHLRARPAELSGPTLLRNGLAISPPADADMRADMIVVTFLNAPTEYEGGELVLDAGWGEQAFKEGAGSCVIYPAEAHAGFCMVVSGAQWCARALVRSQVREAAQRDILFDVSRAARYLEIFKGGSDAAAARLKRCEDSLLRLWRDA